LHDDHTGDRLDISLIPSDDELEEPGQRTGLRLHGGLGLLALSQRHHEGVSIFRSSAPQRTPQEPHELEQHAALASDMAIRGARSGHGEAVLVDQLLLEVLEIGDCAHDSAPCPSIARPPNPWFVQFTMVDRSS
jgi:hypothetical protein